jgi:hypothetical protein
VHSIVDVGSRLEPLADFPEGAAPTRFAWVDGEHAGVLAYRLGPILSWSLIPYTPHLYSREEGWPDIDADPIVRIVLVDRDDHTVKALHEVRWPEEFAATVRASVARMRDVPFSRIEYDHVLAALHRRFPTPEDLVVDRADAQCTASPVHQP